MSRARTVNVHGVYLVDSEAGENGNLVLVFKSGRHHVRLHMHDYMAGNVGQRLHQYLDRRADVIAAARKRLRGET
jgi:hypothetical protein